MHPDKFPVEWQGRTLHLGPLTPDAKKAFCQWLKPRYVFEAWQIAQTPDLPDDVKEHAVRNHEAARAEVNAGGVYWATDMSAPVAGAVRTQAGAVQLARILFGTDVKGWADAELLAMLQAKAADPASDYTVAMEAIWEAADPKETAPASGPSPAPAGTSDTSPASVPATST